MPDGVTGGSGAVAGGAGVRHNGGARRRGPPPAPTVPWVLALLGAFLALQHLSALSAPFFSDDYMFLDKLRNAPFVAVWLPADLAYHWYRPWSRELHYWVFDRLFGLSVEPYHLASFALWLTTVGLYFALLRRAGSIAIATLAVCGAAALAACGVLLEWAPGVQDLWMLVFAMLFLHAFARGRPAWAAAALILALLSKETAAVLPGLAFVYAWTVDRSPAHRAVLRSLPFAAVVLIWAVLHPSLGGSLWWARGHAALPSIQTAPWLAALKSLLALVNLDLVPRPLTGWPRALLAALPGALVLAALAAWGAFGIGPRRAAATGPPAVSARRLIAFGCGWALIAWLPLFMRSVLWQPYYAWFGALGAWLAIAVVLSRRPRVAVALVAALALMRGVRADTPSRDWGNEWTQRFGKTFMGTTESYLKRRFPTPPSGARLYFTHVPRGVVFITGPGNAPALRVWFDSTIAGSYWSRYRPRPPGSRGGDYFFRYDTLGSWVEVVHGPENVDSAMALNPHWKSDHERLALTFAKAGDFAAAAEEYAKLANAFPQSADHAALAALAYEGAGDSAAAALWYRRAAALPGADEELKQRARRFEATAARR